jgi:hypothetical protein
MILIISIQPRADKIKRKPVIILGACLMGSTGTKRRLYLVFMASPVFSFRLPLGVVLVEADCMSGKMVVEAASLATDVKLLHLVIIHKRNSLCKWTLKKKRNILNVYRLIICFNKRIIKGLTNRIDL